MADRSLTDIIRFLDPSGEIGDADIASISSALKFTEVLDLISAVSDDKVDFGRNILAKHDPRFGVAKEYAGAAASSTGGFKPIKPIGSSPTMAQKPTNPNGPQDVEDLDSLVNDPMSKNKPEVKQIQSLVQRLQNR